MTPEERDKLLTELRRKKDEEKLAEMFRDDAGVGRFLAQRNADQNRMGCFGVLLVIGIAALTMLLGKSCLGWR